MPAGKQEPPASPDPLEDEMADINVERKRSGGPNFLPWILGLLLLGALIWGLSRLLGRDDEAETAVPADTTMTTTTVDTMQTTTAPVAPMPMDSAAMAPGAAMPMDSGAAGMGGQVTGARDSAGGDTVAEGPKGNP